MPVGVLERPSHHASVSRNKLGRQLALAAGQGALHGSPLGRGPQIPQAERKRPVQVVSCQTH